MRPSSSAAITCRRSAAPASARRGGVGGADRSPAHRIGELGRAWGGSPWHRRRRASLPPPGRRRCGIDHLATGGVAAGDLLQRAGVVEAEAFEALQHPPMQLRRDGKRPPCGVGQTRATSAPSFPAARRQPLEAGDLMSMEAKGRLHWPDGHLPARRSGPGCRCCWSHHQAVDGQAMARRVAGEDIAEVAGGHGEADRVLGASERAAVTRRSGPSPGPLMD